MTLALLMAAAAVPMSAAEEAPKATEGWGPNEAGEFTIGSVGDMLAFMEGVT